MSLMGTSLSTQGALDWMETRTGRKVSFVNPTIEDIDIVDIAWSLANQCRYAGHCSKFYSIAEHSFLVAQSVPAEDRLWGLLHDATEAYVTDIPKGLKNQLPGYKIIESRFALVIARRFNLSMLCPESVEEADTRILLNEKDALFADSVWPLDCEMLPDIHVEGWLPWIAVRRFIDAYQTYSGVMVPWSRTLMYGSRRDG